MKKILITFLVISLTQPIISIAYWSYYRDRVPMFIPVDCNGSIEIRNDRYGNGHFGAKRRGGRTHKGIDLLASLKSNVYASRGGRVIIGYQETGMGKYVIIIHPGGYSTLYGHLSGILAKDGSRVRQGEIIGLIGKTGNANHRGLLAHLHFEVKKDGIVIDPAIFFD